MEPSSSSVPRRDFLYTAALGIGSIACSTLLISNFTSSDSPQDRNAPTVRPLTKKELAAIKQQAPNITTGEFAVLLPLLANSVEINGPTQGRFRNNLWRRQTATVDNARTQEHVYSLAWFLCANYPWNPYHQDEALRQRLHLAINYYLRLQLQSGPFPELDKTQASLAATAFGIEYLTRTYLLLRRNATSVFLAKLERSISLAISWFMHPSAAHWRLPLTDVNQLVAGATGVALAIDAGISPTPKAELHDRINFIFSEGQSQAGFFYENHGPDIGYNLQVQLPEMAELYELTELDSIRNAVLRFADWLALNAMPLSTSSGLAINSQTSTRTKLSTLTHETAELSDRFRLASRLIPLAPSLSCYFTTSEARKKETDSWRKSLDFHVQTSNLQEFSPRLLAHVQYSARLPTVAGRDREEDALAPKSGPANTFLSAKSTSYIFARRESYYFAASFASTQGNGLATPGPNLFWSDFGGLYVHGTTKSSAWHLSSLDQRDSADVWRLKRVTSGWATPHQNVDFQEARAMPEISISSFDAIQSGGVDTLIGKDQVAFRHSCAEAMKWSFPLVVLQGDKLWIGATECDPSEAVSFSAVDRIVVQRDASRFVIRVSEVVSGKFTGARKHVNGKPSEDRCTLSLVVNRGIVVSLEAGALTL